MNNNKNYLYRMELYKHMDDAKKDGLLYRDKSVGTDAIILTDEFGNPMTAMDFESGTFLFTNAGKHKANHRQYVNIAIPSKPEYMVANYVFKVIADGLFAEKCVCPELDKDDDFTDECMVINHINGNTECNRSSNLEVVTIGMNNAHCAYMREVNTYFPDIVEKIETKNKSGRVYTSYRWTDGIGVSCDGIEKWNKSHADNPIRGIRSKNGKWNTVHNISYIIESLKYFDKI